MNTSFQLMTNRKVIFGTGEREKLVEVLGNFPLGPVALFVSKSVHSSKVGKEVVDIIGKQRDYRIHPVSGEPTPSLIDPLVAKCKRDQAALLIALGGGSVIDTAKAVGAMVCEEGSVADYLEGVGSKKPSGNKIPLIAMPTTGGTGSEATKNAVISDLTRGYKKSLRHDNYIPDLALIDPAFAENCPVNITKSCAVDAFCQLLESYLSKKSNMLTDTLAFEGMSRLVSSCFSHCGDVPLDSEQRSNLAYAAYLSGITLSNAGLGAVHGMGGPLGGLFPIPHGVACGLLLRPVIELTFDKLEVKWMADRWEQKIKRVARLISGVSPKDYKGAKNLIVRGLKTWETKLEFKPLREFGVKKEDFGKIIIASQNKNNPYELTIEDMEYILNSIY